MCLFLGFMFLFLFLEFDFLLVEILRYGELFEFSFLFRDLLLGNEFILFFNIL